MSTLAAYAAFYGPLAVVFVVSLIATYGIVHRARHRRELKLARARAAEAERSSELRGELLDAAEKDQDGRVAERVHGPLRAKLLDIEAALDALRDENTDVQQDLAGALGVLDRLEDGMRVVRATVAARGVRAVRAGGDERDFVALKDFNAAMARLSHRIETVKERVLAEVTEKSQPRVRAWMPMDKDYDYPEEF